MTPIRFALSALLLAVSVSGGSAAAAAAGFNVSALARTDGVKAEKTKKSKGKTRKIQQAEDKSLHGSGETQKMRDQRLTRECRGAVNGGACLGYTR